MLARHDGRVVLVSGAVPGERVVARVERVSRKVVFAATVDVVDASPDRRDTTLDPLCGGMSYAHITLERQRRMKAEIIRDAFRRIARLPIADVIPVAASPERDYRLRGRLHVHGGRAGFYLERTHRVCDPATTGQFRQDALDAVSRLLTRLGPAAAGVASLVIAENVAASQRVIHLEPSPGAEAWPTSDSLADLAGVTGVTAATNGGRPIGLSGEGRVVDTTTDLCGPTDELPADLTWARSAPSFFQGNRYLAGQLMLRVIQEAIGDRVLDLYAGVGLFSVGLAARGARVTAVEGDPVSAADLALNADQLGGAVTSRQTTVEAAAMTTSAGAFDTIVLDPPRTGASAEAVSAVAGLQAQRIVYVSCDPATLARDSASLSAGYRLSSIEAFDLFPNTPHVETLAVFDRRSGA